MAPNYISPHIQFLIIDPIPSQDAIVHPNPVIYNLDLDLTCPALSFLMLVPSSHQCVVAQFEEILVEFEKSK